MLPGTCFYKDAQKGEMIMEHGDYRIEVLEKSGLLNLYPPYNCMFQLSGNIYSDLKPIIINQETES